ncbi:MAG: hypothetical protein MUC88_07045 [Planctomycetes bacterium]|jgi:hypothetical protein|nr:hypothetical protein [Planctomycetota bacterium]
MGTRWFRTIGVGAVTTMTLLTGCHPGDQAAGVCRPKRAGDFVAEQKDYWCVMAPDRIRVTSVLTLRKRPAGAVLMPVTLPCTQARLETAALQGRKLGFQEVGAGAYNIELPADKSVSRHRQITCEWVLPLVALRRESGLYWTNPRSLLPVVSYELRAGAAPQSGFEVFGEEADHRPVAYSWNAAQPMTEFSGHCALPVRRRR